MKELAKILVLESDEQTHVLRLLLPLLPCESEVLPRLLPRSHLSQNNNSGFSWPKVVYHVLERTAVRVHLTMYDCVSVSTYTAAKAVLGPLRDG